MAKWKEMTVYVHGITPEEYPSSHTDCYLKLQSLINGQLKKQGKTPLSDDPVLVEWGWHGSTGYDKNLEEAERKVAAAEQAAYGKVKVPWWQLPFCGATRKIVEATRPLLLYGIADVFYYVSEDGKKTVRKTVFDKILGELTGAAHRLAPDEEGISLTCLGHSAGTLVLHDLLFNIFSEFKAGKPGLYTYINGGQLDNLRRLAGEKKFRLRKLYTFGSPITPIVLRSNDLVGAIAGCPAAAGFLKPADIGLSGSPELSSPRWVNFWSPDDAISYPLEFLYDNTQKVIEDRTVGACGNPIEAHGKYWTDQAMAEYIAQTY